MLKSTMSSLELSCMNCFYVAENFYVPFEVGFGAKVAVAVGAFVEIVIVCLLFLFQWAHRKC
jgi:hypothetical protein